MSSPKRILVVEDDESVRRVASAYLTAEGYEVSEVAHGDEALATLSRESFDLIVLDLMLPGTDGLEIARRLAVDAPEVLVLMLTARSDESDQLIGFGVGADDYLAKPFSPKVLAARVKALLRRADSANGGTGPVTTPMRPADSGTASPSGASDEPVRVGGITIDIRRREVFTDSRKVELTVAEFDLLSKLAEHPGWVYTREQLMTEAWDYDITGASRTVDMHVANIRRKLGEDPERPAHLVTVRGVGYKLTDTPEPPGAGSR